MSLLLDALNRASKDKAAAAAAEAAATPKFDSPAQSLPVLTVDVPVPPGAGSPPAQKPPVLELSLASDAITPAPADAWHTEQSVATTVLDYPAAAGSQPTPTPAPTPSKPVAASIPSPPASPPPAPDNKPAPGKSAREAPRVAQEIVRAKAPTSRTGPPLRLVALGTLAVLLAAGFGSLLLGWWGDPSAWFRAGPTPAPVAIAPSGATRVEPARVTPTESDPSGAPAGATPVAQAPPDQPAATRPGAAQSAPPEPQVPMAAASALASSGPRQVLASAPTKADQAMIQSRTVGPSILEIGYAALVEGRLPAAAQAYGQALLANPEERDALLGLAYVAHQQGRMDEARDYYQRVLRQDPGNPIARSGLLAANAVDDPQLVASRSREVAEQNPDSAAAQSALGHAMVREGRLADAQQAFFRAHSLEPRVAQHAFNLAVALDRLRNFAPARQFYERALMLSAQSGGERASGVPQSVVQTRLEQLRAVTVPNPVGAARE